MSAKVSPLSGADQPDAEAGATDTSCAAQEDMSGKPLETGTLPGTPEPQAAEQDAKQLARLKSPADGATTKGVTAEMVVTTLQEEGRDVSKGTAGWTHAPVLFDKRVDGIEAPLLVPREFLVSGKAPKTDFQNCRPGTTVFTYENVYVRGSKAVGMGVRGKVVPDMAGLQKADDGAPPGLDEDVDCASHFVRLHTGKDGRRTFDPPQIVATGGQIVHFSWHAQKAPIRLLETDKTFSLASKADSGLKVEDKDGDRECNFALEGVSSGDVIYLACDAFPEDARVTIKIVSATFASVLNVLWRLVALILAAVLLIILAFVAVDVIEDADFVDSFFDCQGVALYCDTMAKLKSWVFDTAAVPLVCGATIVVLGIPATIINLLWPAAPLRSFKEGFTRDVAFFMRLLASSFLVLPVCFLIADWVLTSKYSWGITDLLHLLGSFIDSTLDDLFTLLSSASKLLEVAGGLEYTGERHRQLQSIDFDQILAYEGKVRAYAQLGIDLLSTLVFLRLTLNFLCLLVVVVCLSYGFAGLVRRSPESLHTSFWQSFVAMAAVLWLLGFNSFVHELWLETYDTYTSVDGLVSLPPEGVQPLALTLLAGCSSEGSKQVPIDQLLQPLGSVLGAVGAASSVSFADAPVTADEVAEFAAKVRSQVDSLRYWASQPDASWEDFQSLGVADFLTHEQFSATLTEGLGMLDVILDVIQCRQIGPFLGGLQRILDHEVLPASQTIVFTERGLAVLLVLWGILAKVVSEIFRRPRKIYHDRVSKRWFRFKFCYYVSVKLRKSSVGNKFVEHRVEGYWWNTLEFLHGVLLLNTVMLSVLFIGGCMLLFLDRAVNPTSGWMLAGAILLMLSSALGFAGGWANMGLLRNRLLRGFSVLVVVAGAACIAHSAADNYQREVDCIAAVGYDPLAEGPTASMSFTLASAATRASGGWSLDVTGPGLMAGDRLALYKDAEGCPQPSGKAPDATSLEATLFGRHYPFETELAAGEYVMCWCSNSADCTDPGSYAALAGRAYVDRPVDRFKACTLEVLAGMSQAAAVALVILPFCLLRVVLGVATLFHLVYSAHISDRQRRAVGKTSAPAGASSGAAKWLDGSQWYHRLSLKQWLLLSPVFVLVLVGVIVIAAIAHGPSRVCYVIGGCTSPPPESPAYPSAQQSCETCCNLQEATCSKRVDQAAFATVHNAMSSEEKLWNFPNNLYDLQKQLDAGVRGLMLDVHYRWFDNQSVGASTEPGDVYLCHGTCGLGRARLVDSLVGIRQFLDNNPRELIVLILEQYVASYSVIKDLEASGLMAHCCYGHSSSLDPWPTVGELVDTNRRLLIFSNRDRLYTGQGRDGNSIPRAAFGPDFAATTNVNWYHWQNEYMATTSYSYTSTGAMTADCSLDSPQFGFPITDFATTSQSAPVGSAAHRLLIANHFISNPLPCESCAREANRNASLKTRMLDCRAQWGHQVNFPAVDFWAFGELVRVSGHLNEQP